MIKDKKKKKKKKKDLLYGWTDFAKLGLSVGIFFS